MTEKQQDNWDKGVEWKYPMSPRARVIIENNIKNLLATQASQLRKELVKEVTNLVAEEIIVANMSKQPTSRLTSLAVKLGKIREGGKEV